MGADEARGQLRSDPLERRQRVDAASETCTEQQRFTATLRGKGSGGGGGGGGTFEETQNTAGGRKRH